jgi:hypothetical protein
MIHEKFIQVHSFFSWDATQALLRVPPLLCVSGLADSSHSSAHVVISCAWFSLAARFHMRPTLAFGQCGAVRFQVLPASCFYVARSLGPCHS